MESLIFLALLVVSFYLLIIRPTRNRARAAAALQNQLEPGLEVMTGSGIYGRVTRVDVRSTPTGYAVRVAGEDRRTNEEIYQRARGLTGGALAEQVAANGPGAAQ